MLWASRRTSRTRDEGGYPQVDRGSLPSTTAGRGADAGAEGLGGWGCRSGGSGRAAGGLGGRGWRGGFGRGSGGSLGRRGGLGGGFGRSAGRRRAGGAFDDDGGPADGLGVAAVLGHGRREFGQAAEGGEAGAGGEEIRAPACDGVEACGGAVHRGRSEQVGEPVECQPVAVAEVERGEGGVEEVADELGRDGLVVCVHDDEGTGGPACRKGDWG